MTNEILSRIGKAWTKSNGEIRYYVNDWQEMIDLDVGYYKTGNVFDVTYKGERRSNCWYKKYVSRTKVWVDESYKVHVDYCEDSDIEKAVVKAVGTKIDMMCLGE